MSTGSGQFERRGFVPTIREFDDILKPEDSLIEQMQGKIVQAARNFGLRDMPDVVDEYLLLSQQARRETGQEITPNDQEQIITMPIVELDVDLSNVSSVYRQLASGVMIPWVLMQHRAFRVPWTSRRDDEPVDIFSGKKESGAYLFNRVLPSTYYLKFANIYLDQLGQVQNWHSSEIKRLRSIIDSIPPGSNP